MQTNVLTNPKETFKMALEAPSIKISILIILISSLIFSGITQLITNDLILTSMVFLLSITQWLVFSIIYWAFEFSFKTKRGFSGINFTSIISATSQLWILTIIFGILLLIALIGGIITIIVGILSLVLGILFLIYSFILMKVIIDQDNLSTFIAWILALILHALLIAIASGIAQTIVYF